MDNILTKENAKIADSGHTGSYFLILAALCAIFIAVGMKIADSTGIIDGIQVYGRYDGLSAVTDVHGIAIHITEAILCALPCLFQIFSLFILSFSSLLFPASIIVIGCRGFLLGSALSLIGSTGSVLELILFAVSTAVICVMCAVFLSCCKNSTARQSDIVIKKSLVFFMTSGICTVGEVFLSFMI